MQKIILCFILILAFNLNAQKKTNKEFGFISDNDLYVSYFLDQYYTSGLEIFYKRVDETNFLSFEKKIKDFRIGQYIYNPFNYDIVLVRQQDRPYAGYLFASYTENYISTKHLFKIGIDTGITGKNSGAEWAQNFIHQFYDLDPSNGWNTQVKQKLSVGIKIDHTYNLFYNPEKKIQIATTHKIQLNRIFSNISSGIDLKLNTSKEKSTGINNSVFYGTALQLKDEPWIKECFLGIKSFVTYQIADYTVTGELNNNFTHKNFNISPWVWTNDIGYYWNLKRWNVSYHQIFYTKNTKEIFKDWVKYGSIRLSYKF